MATFLLEVGTEELPASFVADALAQWETKIPASLTALGISATLQTYGTPRRLAALLTDLPDRQPDRLLEVKGPAVAAAFVHGEPTKAAIGFAKAQGVTVADLTVRDTEKGPCVFAQRQEVGRPVAEVLTELAPTWILGLEGQRLMRWGHGDLKFPRPIRWLVALLDDRVLPIALEGLAAGRQTWGHRVLSKGPVILDRATDYLPRLREAGVLADVAERRERICQQMAGVAELMGAHIEVLPDLLAEVVHLVEFPTAVVGEFDREFLTLPEPAIVMEMVVHQRYFPVYDRGNPRTLLPYFLTVSNGDPAKSKQIAQGNGRVIRARLADGKFFYDADRAIPLADFGPQLRKVTFQEQLGSMADKVERMQAIAAILPACAGLNLDAQTQAHLHRAIALCKADLVTQLVGEFPELQGVAGSYYAQSSGEPAAVAQAIGEHYRPRGAGDALPQTLLGQLVAIADRLDSLAGIFGLGLIPTGSSDPFALRRAAQAIVQIAWHASLPLDIPQALAGAIAAYGSLPHNPQSDLETWFAARIRTLLEERGIDYDLVDAVLGEGAYRHQGLRNVLRLRERADFLQAARQDGSLERVAEVVKRASRLAVNLTEAIAPQGARCQHPAEQAFYAALQNLPPNPSFAELWQGLQGLAPVLAQFFEAVLVMAEDETVRQNRLALLAAVRDYSLQLADFAHLRG